QTRRQAQRGRAEAGAGDGGLRLDQPQRRRLFPDTYRATEATARRRKYRRWVSDLCRDAEAMGRFARPPRESVDERRPPRRRRLRRQPEIAIPEILGDGDYGLTSIGPRPASPWLAK